MPRIAITEKTVKKLKKEAANNLNVLHILYRESIARKWLKSHGIFSLRNPVTPPEDGRLASNGRYSIILADGSRLLVCSYPSAWLSLEMLAAAKCFAVLAVNLGKDQKSGAVMGCKFLPDISKTARLCCFNHQGLESNSILLHYLGERSSSTARYFGFCTRLLLFGEPDAPEIDTKEAKMFYPAVGN